jgi:hypothetical protein
VRHRPPGQPRREPGVVADIDACSVVQ